MNNERIPLLMSILCVIGATLILCAVIDYKKGNWPFHKGKQEVTQNVCP